MNRTIDILKRMGTETDKFVKILQMDTIDRGMEEEFIFVELTECYGDEAELLDTISYLSREIWLEGEISAKGAHYYLGDHRLMDNEDFEFEIDGTWCRSKVLTIMNEDYIELFGLRPGKDKIRARIRG